MGRRAEDSCRGLNADGRLAVAAAASARAHPPDLTPLSLPQSSRRRAGRACMQGRFWPRASADLSWLQMLYNYYALWRLPCLAFLSGLGSKSERLLMT